MSLLQIFTRQLDCPFQSQLLDTLRYGKGSCTGCLEINVWGFPQGPSNVIGTHDARCIRQYTYPCTTNCRFQSRQLGCPRGVSLLRLFQFGKRHITKTPSDSLIAHEYADALAGAKQHEALTQFVPEAPLTTADKTYFLLRANANQKAIELANKDLSLNHRRPLESRILRMQ